MISARYAVLLGLVVVAMLTSGCVPLPPANHPLAARTGAHEPAPTAFVGMVYFAVATSDATEMLVMYDIHDPRNPGDTNVSSAVHAIYNHYRSKDQLFTMRLKNVAP